MFKSLSFKKRLYILLAVLSLSSVAFLLTNLRPTSNPINSPPTPTPPTQITSDNPQISVLKPESYSFSSVLNSFPYPASLPTYEVDTPVQIFLSPIFKQIVDQYKLEVSSTSPDYYYSKDKSIIVHFDAKNQYVSYAIDGSIRPSAYIGNKPPSLNSAITSAKKFLQQFPEFTQLEPQSNLTQYQLIDHVPGEFEIATSPSEANIITLYFTQYIQGYPYRYSGNTSTPVIIHIGQNNQVTNAYLSPQTVPVLTNPTEKSLLSSSEILSALNSGKGTVIYAPLYNFPPNVTTLAHTTITQIQIEYRYDPTSRQLLPYYLMNGEFTPEPTSNKSVEIQILLPAIKPGN